jgi:hypothetical protein
MISKTAVTATRSGLRVMNGIMAGLVSILALSGLYVLVRSLKWPIVHDTALLHYVAWRILSGDVPYKEIFEPNFPGIYLVHMFILKVLGPGDVQWQIFNIAAILLSAAAIAVFCRPAGGWAAAVAPALFAAICLSQGATDMGQRDFLMVPLVLFSAHFLAVVLDRSRTWMLIPSGLLLGISFTLKPFALLLFLLFLFIFIVHRRKHRRASVGGSLLFLGSFSIPVALVLVWLQSLGALGSFIDIVTRYLLPLYGKLERRGPVFFTLFLLAQLFFLSPALVSLPILKFREFIQKPRNVILIAGLFYGLLHFVLQGKGFIYHLFPFFGFVTVFAGILVDRLMKDPSARVRATAVIGFFFMVYLYSNRCFEVGRRNMTVEEIKPLVPKLVRELQAYPVTGKDEVQVLDTTEGAIHALFLLRIRQPTRFINDYQFLHDTGNPYIQKLRAEFIRDLEARSPRLIVAANYSWIPPNTIARLHQFPEFEKLLDSRYRVYKVENEFTIYANRSDSTGTVR